ncbi:hypothetical protein Q4R42_05165 [Morganella morganii subsp. sibonii]|uniref:hypothetical protein n=1 Tax=Morganella morganii TaxID=582 RepID=UPI001BD3BD27|nr:hypothetical protein [Morganella morganii]MBS9541915.1 hypothetical protein [Morganella morganii subsp. morganii]
MKKTKHYQVYKTEDMNIHREIQEPFNYNAISRPEITLFVAPQGSEIYDINGELVSNSTFGHTFIGIKGINPVTKQYDIITVGLSTGESLKTASDNLSFNDHIYYRNASTLSITSDNFKFHNDFNNLFTVLHNYKTGKSKPPNYNLLTNNCGQFVDDLLTDSNIDGINVSFFPDNLYENLENAADSYCTPLIIDLDRNGVITLSDNTGIYFDLNGNGESVQTGWVHPDDGLLALDRNNDGNINNGTELFGEYTGYINNKDGFSSLSVLDSNNDHLINQDDIAWSALLVWQDVNSDGISQSDELLSLESIGIVSVELTTRPSCFYDDNGNFHKLTSDINWHNGEKTEITDVLFHIYNQEKISLPEHIYTTDFVADKNNENYHDIISTQYLIG